VSILHGVPGATVDVYADGNALLKNFKPGTLTDPQRLPAGTYDLKVVKAGDGADGDAVIQADNVKVPAGSWRSRTSRECIVALEEFLAVRVAKRLFPRWCWVSSASACSARLRQEPSWLGDAHRSIGESGRKATRRPALAGRLRRFRTPGHWCDLATRPPGRSESSCGVFGHSCRCHPGCDRNQPGARCGGSLGQARDHPATTWPTQPATPEQVDPDQPGLPQLLIIPRLELQMPIVATKVDEAGLMDLPDRPTRIGWYSYGPRPGVQIGSAVLGGHVDSRKYGIGPLADLDRLSRGDQIIVRTASGSSGFEVESVRRISKQELPVSEIFARLTEAAHCQLRRGLHS
jgi:hypothetical protein